MAKIGYPIPKNVKGKSLYDSIKTSCEIGFRAFQVNMTSTHNSQKGKKLSLIESKQILDIKDKYKLYGVVHGKYTYNFCRKDCAYQVDLLVHELELSADIGCDVILHQGKNVKEENLTRLQAINNYVKHISEALEKASDLGNGILLENSARQGSELGYSLAELVYIYNQFDDKLKSRVGFCLDLCHIFVAGELDIRNKTAVENYLVEFDNLVGLNKLKVIHFNDSSVPFAAYNDRHGDIHCGYISNPLLGGNHEGFRVISEVAKNNNIGIIFETPCAFGAYHLGMNQLFWQLIIVSDWSLGNNTIYEKYDKKLPNLKQIAYQYYDQKKTKVKSKKLEQIILPPCECHKGEEKKDAKPVIKIPIKLKLKSNNETTNIPILIESTSICIGNKIKIKLKDKI